MSESVHLTIDGISVDVPKGTTVYTAIKNLNIDVPIFCYHDRMPPFGACRVCMVEVEGAAKPQTSCTLLAQEAMVVRTQADQAVRARQDILEFLLINHPLDCPICDRGGECPLQDQVVEFGPGKSRFFEEKRHFVKPYSLGPVLTLDRERCIQCARCTRFGDIISGDHALEFIDRGHKMEVGTADGGPAQSKFIGNTIMICPVGALTSSVYRFRARPWDNDTTPTTCTLCPVGCSMLVDSRDGEIQRTRSDENGDVNDVWLCDKGWFGYEFSSHPDRLVQPLIRRHGELVSASWEEAFSFIAAKLHEAKKSERVAAFGGNTLTVEENYLFQKLFRDMLGTPHVDHRIGQPLFTLADEGLAAGMQGPIKDVPQLSRALLLGLDITEEFPVLWLRLKSAVNSGGKLAFMGHCRPEIGRYLHSGTHSCTLHRPGDELHTLRTHKEALIRFLKESPAPALFVGSGYLATKERKAIIQELISWQKELPTLRLHVMDASNNSMGARFAGMHPECGPQAAPVKKQGLSWEAVMNETRAHGWQLLYVAGADPAAKMPAHQWEEVRKNLGCLIVQDLFLTKSAASADVVLPTLSFVEKGGSFITIEGRVQKLKPTKTPPKRVYSDSYIFAKIAQQFGYPLQIDEPFLDRLQEKVVIQERMFTETTANPAAASPETGLRATFTTQLFDQGNRMKHNTHLVELSKTPYFRMHPDTLAHYGLTDGAVISLEAEDNPKVSVKSVVQQDPHISADTVVVPYGFASCNAHELGLSLYNGMRVRAKSN